LLWSLVALQDGFPPVESHVSAVTIGSARSDYRELADQVRNAGLLRPRPVYYTVKITATLLGLAAAWTALILVGNSWAALGVAAVMAVMFTQVLFLGHDAGHQQIFKSRRANRLSGLAAGNLLTGLSFGWWVPKHNAHHAHPNQIERDPDIGPGVIAFTSGVARGRQGAAGWLARWQAWVFFPLLLLEAVVLHISSVQTLGRRRDRSAALEAALLVAHTAVYLSVVFWVLSPLRALAFIAIQQGLFGLYLGCSFVSNHTGMPVFPRDDETCFAERQIVTTRNVAGGRFITFLLGGLNHQIEHHLFPSMARCNLRRAENIVRAFCAEHSLAYHQDTLLGCYGHVLRHLHAMGHGQDDPMPATAIALAA
jgi:fatty acid desaturase